MSRAGRVLIVDDDCDLQRAYRRLLELHGFLVLQKFDGHSGLAAAVAELPDAIVLDVDLPDADGRDVLVALKANIRTAGIAVIICSGRTCDVDRVAAVRNGAHGYLDKPCNLALLALLRDIELAGWTSLPP